MKFKLCGHICIYAVGLFIMLHSAPVMADTLENRIFPECTGSSASINASSVNIRSYPGKYSDVILCADKEKVFILGTNQNYYKVRLNGKEGWIQKDYVDIQEDAFIPCSKVLGEEVVEYGKQFIGTPYVWGGNDLKKGVDCSGLTQKVFKGFDINISRLSYMQAEDGQSISKDELRPGDLVFFDTSGKNNGNITHVGIYAGDGMFLHADCTKGVTLSRLSSSYYTKNYVTGSRILKDA